MTETTLSSLGQPQDPKFEPSQTVESLVYLLASEQEESRSQAYASVVSIGSRAVLPLITLLHDENSSARYYAVSALADIADPIAVEPLLTMLTDEDEEVRSAAVSALGEIGDIRGVVPLLALLQDKSEGSWVRSYTADALGKLGDHRAVEPLIDALLNDRSGVVRSNAARALGLLGDHRAVDPLIQAITPDLSSIEDADDTTELEITWNSAWSLAQLGDPRSMEPLIRLLLESPSDSLQRMVAIETLGALADERALAALDSVQKHERPADETLAESFDRYIADAIKRIKQRQAG
jgi:HEAT repeat protein